MILISFLLQCTLLHVISIGSITPNLILILVYIRWDWMQASLQTRIITPSRSKFCTCFYGELTITKRNVTLTSADDEKVYDGTALTNSIVTVSGDGFVTNEAPSYDVIGTITNVGEVDNEFTYAFAKGVNADNIQYYNQSLAN